ncbi:hypothetical protein Tco_0663469 [Tanacetum coccineum]
MQPYGRCLKLLKSWEAAKALLLKLCKLVAPLKPPISGKVWNDKDKSEQKQSKTDKKRKRQVQERNLKPIAKAGSARQQEKKVNESQRIYNDKCAKFKGSFG